MQYLVLFLKGMGIGVANLIPGVSGGTLALIFNVFERFIGALKRINLNTFKCLLRLFTFRADARRDFMQEMRRIDAAFLIALLLGMGIAILAFSSLMSYLLAEHHEVTFGFFFGFILVSIYVPFALIRSVNWKAILGLIIAAVAVISMSFMQTEAQQIANEEAAIALEAASGGQAVFSAMDYVLMLLSGALAVSAMILPGVSGSFILLMIGQYFTVLEAVSSLNLPILACFGVGVVLGILLFSRFLNFLLNRFHDVTMGVLTGLVAGSLYAIWPFKYVHILSNGEALYLRNILPASFGLTEGLTLLAAIVSGLIVVLFIYLQKKHPEAAE